MKMNQIILDICDWIRRTLWYREKRIKSRPYEILETYSSPHGILKLVRRDTPRAVRTYIFTPHNSKGQDRIVQKDLKDIHICLDHLWALDTNETSHVPKIILQQPYKARVTHAITILEASRWVTKDGNYYSKVLFSRNYDFIGTDWGAWRDKYAMPIINDLASLLRYRPFKEMDWGLETELSQKNFMGGHFIRRQYGD